MTFRSLRQPRTTNLTSSSPCNPKQRSTCSEWFSRLQSTSLQQVCRMNSRRTRTSTSTQASTHNPFSSSSQTTSSRCHPQAARSTRHQWPPQAELSQASRKRKTCSICLAEWLFLKESKFDWALVFSIVTLVLNTLNFKLNNFKKNTVTHQLCSQYPLANVALLCRPADLLSKLQASAVSQPRCLLFCNWPLKSHLCLPTCPCWLWA